MSKKSASRIAHKFSGMRDFVKFTQDMGQRHSTWQVFEDFLSIAAISISNSVAPDKAREDQYLAIVKNYSAEELDMFAQMFADLVNTMEKQAEDAPADILGPIFHELELHNKYKGQFFTPQHICDFMGAVSAPADKELAKAEIEKLGHFEVSEPCVGSGALIFGFARAMKNVGLNYCSDMCVTAVDIDIKCVYMAYIQLSLYGIPAVVVHGDSLFLKEWSHWYTPIYVLNMWDYRRKRSRGQPALTTHSEPEKPPVAAAVEDAAQQFVIKKNGQISMF